MITEGVLTGCNDSHEWMLKMWWEYYSQTNTYPVIFCDFGMSKSARMWCEKRGDILSLDLAKNPAVPKKDISSKIWEEWEKAYTDIIWTKRPTWFLKPHATFQSPFEKSIWLDLDTFIIKPLTPLMEASDETGIAMSHCYDKYNFNTGVISYKKNLPLIKQWAETTYTLTDQFLGDQETMNHLIHTQKIPVKIMPSIFNQRFQYGISKDTFIIHFTGAFKKELFKKIYKPKLTNT